MGNQQLAPADVDLAYLAGIIDGEGSVAMRRNGNKKQLWFTPALNIYNTDRDLIYWCRDVLQALGAGVHVGQHTRAHGRKVQYVLTIQRMESLLNVLPRIIPFLRQKKYRAELLLEFSQRRIGRKGEQYSSHDLEVVALVYEANGDRGNNSETVRAGASRLKRQSMPDTKVQD